MKKVCWITYDKDRNVWFLKIQDGIREKEETVYHFYTEGRYVDANILRAIDKLIDEKYVFIGII